MRMILYAGLMTVVLLLHPGVVGGDDHSHRKAAETLLLVMEVDKSLPPIAEQVLDNQLKHNPQRAPQRDVMQRFLSQYLSWESVKENTITAYTQDFTEKELKQLTDFYKTPLGRKTSNKLPKLAVVAVQVGLIHAQEHQAELRQLVVEKEDEGLTAAALFYSLAA
jgi:uncharacterized protein